MRGERHPGAKSTRTWITSRPETLRSCRSRSVRVPRLLRLRNIQDQAPPAISTARVRSSRFMQTSYVPGSTDHCADRSDLKEARSSAEKSSGCSQAAKCPPLLTSLK